MFSMGRCRVSVVTAVVLWMSLCSTVWAKPVSPERALNAADGFLKARTPAAPKVRHTLSAAAKSRSPSGIQAVTSNDGAVLAYVATLDPAGFIITSADTNVTPVVAYSFQGAFDPASDRLSPLYLLLTQDMKLRALAAGQGIADAAANSDTWTLYESSQAATQTVQQWPAENTTTTGGWVETTWHQLAPYDDLCPLDPADGQRSVVGCVATAMAQLLNYHKRSGATFSFSDAYTTGSGVDIDTDSVRYSFPSFSELNGLLAALQLKYAQQVPLDDGDAAALSLACGLAVKMDYSSTGSGAVSTNVVTALLDKGKFGLSSADLINGLSSQTIQVVQENLINRLPVLMGIRTPDGLSGHLIVCDGYNTNGDYHLNFGWTSSKPAPITEAWYRLPSEIPSVLTAISDVIVNIQPVLPNFLIDPIELDFIQTADQRGQIKTFTIRNNPGPVHVNSISCPQGFVAAVGDSNEYSDHTGPFDMLQRNQEVGVHVWFNPPSPGGYYGTLAVNYDDGRVRYVVLHGDAYAGGTGIAGGAVSGTWSAAGSPYYVLGDVQVAASGQLTIEPGVQVVFAGHYSLTVGAGAQLVAQGTAAKPIVFTAANTQLGFGGLRLVGTGDDDVLSYCTITYAKKGVGPVGTDYGIRDLSGGALYLYDCSPTITHCILANNVGDGGGAIYCNSSDPIISNTVIVNNACMGGSPQAGGICCTGDSTLRIDNCTIANNSPGGLYTDATYDAEMTNTILWGNRDYQILTYEAVVEASACDVQGGYSGDGNIDADPNFFNPTPGIGPDYDGAAANWTLKSTSPCINAGGASTDSETDLAGNPRVYSDIVDIGAYENQSDLALMTVTPAGQLDAGFAAVNTPQSASLDIANTGKRDLTITQVDVNDPNGVFSLISTVAGKVLAPGESAHVVIGFAPTQEKVSTATLHIHSTAANARDRQVLIQGVGTAGTVVSGTVSGTWAKAKSPYTVTGDVFISRTKTLTIEPGS